MPYGDSTRSVSAASSQDERDTRPFSITNFPSDVDGSISPATARWILRSAAGISAEPNHEGLLEAQLYMCA